LVTIGSVYLAMSAPERAKNFQNRNLL